MTDRILAAASVRATEPFGLSDLAEKALARLIEEMGTGTCSGEATRAMGEPCAAAMAYALCDAEEETSSGIVDELLEAGLTVHDVCFDHLAPAARRLGELWEEDKLPFTDVTLATARIQSMLRRMPSGRKLPVFNDAKGAVFAAVPGEEHTLGVMMAADLFRRKHWDVCLLVGLTHGEMMDRLRRDDRPVIGLSCSGDHSYDALTAVLKDLSRHRKDAEVLLSGQIVEQEDRVADLPAPVTLIKDAAEAEAVLARLDQKSLQPA